MVICDGCGIDRKVFVNGVCIVCTRGDKQGIELKKTANANVGGVEVESDHKDNDWMEKFK